MGRPNQTLCLPRGHPRPHDANKDSHSTSKLSIACCLQASTADMSRPPRSLPVEQATTRRLGPGQELRWLCKESGGRRNGSTKTHPPRSPRHPQSKTSRRPIRQGIRTPAAPSMNTNRYQVAGTKAPNSREHMRTRDPGKQGCIRTCSLPFAAVRLCSLISGRPVQVGLGKPFQYVCNGLATAIPRPCRGSRWSMPSVCHVEQTYTNTRYDFMLP